jgi:hypothetical protein
MARLLAVLTLALLSGAPPSYSGLWYRVDSKSDDPKARIEAATRGFIEKESRGRQTAEDVDPRLLGELRRVLDTFVLYPEELRIEESSKELVLDDGGPRLRIYYLDGEEHERQMPNGTRLETTATRSGSQIDVFQKSNRGAKLFETYRLSDDGRQLTLVVRLEDKQLKEPLVVRSVYTRAD